MLYTGYFNISTASLISQQGVTVLCVEAYPLPVYYYNDTPVPVSSQKKHFLSEICSSDSRLRTGVNAEAQRQCVGKPHRTGLSTKLLILLPKRL
ncbi:hypothetical protein ACU8KH_01492 [Lachancea thermotolerans]